MKTLAMLGGVVAMLVATVGGVVGEDAPIDATDLDALRAAAGTEVSVAGRVVDVGSTSDNRITFLNVGLPKKQGFAAVIFEENYGAFPDGLAGFRNQSVVVSGVIELFRNQQPQIVLRSPEQIRVVEAESE